MLQLEQAAYLCTGHHAQIRAHRGRPVPISHCVLRPAAGLLQIIAHHHTGHKSALAWVAHHQPLLAQFLNCSPHRNAAHFILFHQFIFCRKFVALPAAAGKDLLPQNFLQLQIKRGRAVRHQHSVVPPKADILILYEHNTIVW